MKLFKKRETPEATYWRRQFHETLLDLASREAIWIHERQELEGKIKELEGKL